MLTVTVDLKLSSEEEADLRRILDQEKDKAWPKGFVPYAAAAVEEYARMFLGQKVFTRGSDVREYRLFLLIQSAFGKVIPDEQRVCALFQCTLSQSRALFRAVMSKYQYGLSNVITDTIKAVLARAVKDDDGGIFLFTVNNGTVVAELNKLLALEDPGQDEVARQSGKLRTYELQPAAYQSLCERFKVTPVK
jgi:hypothetical protein